MHVLPDLPNAGLGLLLAPRPLRRQLLTALSVELALAGPLRVLDGGNSCDARRLARELRRRTRAYQAALARVQLARAFTCAQLADLLAQTPGDGRPTLVLELLSTFADESLPLPERRQLLGACLQQLTRLGQCGLVLIGAGADQQAWLPALTPLATTTWHFELPAARSAPRLFPE